MVKEKLENMVLPVAQANMIDPPFIKPAPGLLTLEASTFLEPI